MPDKNTDWTADNSFWDEGWNDMEQRLDRQRRRRLLLPLLLCLLVVGAGAGALVLWNLPPETSLVTDAAPATPPVADVPAGTAAQPATVPPVAATAPERTPDAANAPGTGQATTPRITAQVRPGIPAAPAVPATTSNLSVPEEAPPTPPVPSFPAVDPVIGIESRVDPLTPLAPGLLIFDPELPQVRPAAPADPLLPADSRSRYLLAAGTQLYPGSFLPGAYGMVERRFWRGDWFFPGALRYDYSRRGLVQLPEGGATVELVSYNPTTTVGNVAAYRVQLDESSIITTHSASVRAGAGRHIGPRFALSAGGAYTYLFAGTGPAVNLSDQNGSVVAQPTTADFFDLGGVAQADMNSGFNGVLRAGNYPVYTVNRSLVSAWLRAEYRLSGPLNLSLGYTRHLTPLYRGGDLRAEGSRLELGVLYGF